MRTRTARKIAAFIPLLAVGLAACGSDTSTSTTTSLRPTTTAVTGVSTSSSSSTTPAPTVAAIAFFVRNEKVGGARRAVTAQSATEAALESLMAGPTRDDMKAGLTTVIPAGTKLLGYEVANGVATVDLSSQFATGGGSLSMTLRVAQVVFTATQTSEVASVKFKIAGKPVTSIGGEGVLVDGPQSRADWEDSAPAILVESPLPGDVIAAGTEVSGSANVFEAVFRVRLVDSAGTKVLDQQVIATSGTGTRGTFSTKLTFANAAEGDATLTVYEPSPKDGSDTNVVNIPVKL